MTYTFQDRIRHTSRRMAEVNTSCAIYVRGNIQRPIDVSPVLISAEELGPSGEPSLTLLQRHDFALWRCDPGPDGRKGLGNLYPPQDTDKIVWNGDTFAVNSMGSGEPPYIHTTSNRERIIIHTVRVGLEP